MAVLVVVLILAGAVGAVAYALHRTRTDVEPTVREFAEFRDAISRQVDGLHNDTETTAHHGAHHGAHQGAHPAGGTGQTARKGSNGSIGGLTGPGAGAPAARR